MKITEIIVLVKVDGKFYEVGMNNNERIRVLGVLPKPLNLSGEITSPDLIENDNPLFIEIPK